jgi:O-antigen/teichoic acid export membrane protein
MTQVQRPDSVAQPTLWLIAGRGVGFLAAFIVPLILVRVFDQATFGTYKQLFLIYATLFGVAQIGVAESLYYFVPRDPSTAGRHASNAIITLAAAGVVSVVVLGGASESIAQWLTNDQLADTLVLLGVFLALMLTSAVAEIVLVSRRQYETAAYAYAGSDIVRAAFVLVPAIAIGTLRGVLWGAVAFAATRLVVMLWYFSRSINTLFRPSLALWKSQWAYTLPFALAVGIEVIQGNVHHYVVASRFDPATFAIYAVGCLQIPLVDVMATSAANVLMVKMAENGFDTRGPAALALWHDTMSRLAIVIVPLTMFLLVMARDIIVTLFTASYLASVPIFMLWTLTIVSFVPCVDAMLRVHAQTRFLFGLNLLRLALVLGLTTWFLSWYGLSGAVLVVLISTFVVRVIGLVRIARLLDTGLATVLPWARLVTTAVCSVISAAPTMWFANSTTLPRPLVLACAAGLYAATYAALCYGVGRFPLRAAPAPVLQDVSL